MEHPLTIWLRREGLTRDEFADRIKVSKQTLLRLIHGIAETTTTMIRRVSAGTDGAVSEKEIFDAFISAREAKKTDCDGMVAPLSEEA